MYIPRTLDPAIREHLNRKEITIITGPRQSGKTSLLQALYRELKNEGQEVHYITFEDYDTLSAINTHPEEVFTFIPRPPKNLDSSDTTNKRSFLFIDEVQYADNPSNLLKYLYDVYHKSLKIVATGSSAFYLDEKFTDSLAGRKRIFELKTLSFGEFLVFKKSVLLHDELLRIRDNKEYISSSRRELMQMFDEYLVFGGYPAIALENGEEEKVSLLKELRNSFLKKDMDEAAVSQPDKFYNFLAILAGQTGNLVNKNELANTIGVDNKTIDKYLHVLQKCFHIDLVRPFYSNLRKELTKMQKVYFRDAGMRNVALNRFYDFRNRDDQGALLENYVFKRLTDLYDKDNIKFWRTTVRHEIDFVTETSFQKGLAWEVKMNCRNIKSASINKFSEIYRAWQVKIISYEIGPDCTWVLKL